MRIQNPTDRDRFIHEWACNRGFLSGAITLLAAAKVVERVATMECNGEDIPPRLLKSYQKAKEEAESVCRTHGFSVRFGGDPRGYTTKVFFPSEAYNTWGGVTEGWGVPTR